MRRVHHPRSARGGFTLVELLVVVTIIAVLVALTSAAVMSAFGRGTDVQARNEVSQLTTGVQAFKTQFQVQFVPDRLILPPAYDPTGATQQFLTSAWPRIDRNMVTQTSTSNTYPIASRQTDPAMPANQKSVTVFTYWQVTGTTAQTLQGDQVLVWMLGGWRDSENVHGFSTDPTDPLKPYTAGQQRHGPFFEGFTTDRLVVFGGTGRAAGFPSFVDVYGGKVPYMYFSSGKAGNDYTTTPHVVPSVDPNTGSVTTKQVLPYKLGANKYANASGFQIVCAGKDNVFGSGDTQWSGVTNATLSVGVKDDIANFAQGRLGD